MNIHMRAISRLLKITAIPAIIGLVVGIVINMMTAQQMIFGLSVGFIVFMFWLFYSWTLEEIKQEDQIKSMMKND